METQVQSLNKGNTAIQVDILSKIESELNRLQVSVDFHPYSGLMAEIDDDGIKVFDDYASEIYDANQLLAILSETVEATLSDVSDKNKNIWQIIRPAIF